MIKIGYKMNRIALKSIITDANEVNTGISMGKFGLVRWLLLKNSKKPVNE